MIMNGVRTLLLIICFGISIGLPYIFILMMVIDAWQRASTSWFVFMTVFVIIPLLIGLFAGLYSYIMQFLVSFFSPSFFNLSAKAGRQDHGNTGEVLSLIMFASVILLIPLIFSLEYYARHYPPIFGNRKMRKILLLWFISVVCIITCAILR